MLSIIVLMILFAGSSAQISIHGPCPNITPMRNFDLTRFTGVWYEVQRYDNFFEVDQKCTIANYNIVDNDGFSLMMKSIIASAGATVQLEAVARAVSNISFAQFHLAYSQYADIHSAIISILDTDYETYAVKWMCLNMNDMRFSQIIVWNFSRSNKLSNATREQVRELLHENYLPSDPLHDVRQNDCPPVS